MIRDPQGTFDPQALLCTDSSAEPIQILEWFVLRWQLEVTFQEVRTHLGVWRPSASGPTWPSPVPHPSCWVSSPGPPWPPTSCNKSIPLPSAPRPGTTNRRRLSWMPSPWCVATCVWRRRVSNCRLATLMSENSPPPCTTEWWIPSLTPLEMRKVAS